ncbi:MAG: hypothetical protein WEA58_08400 [Balneolaceae bacterium]
MKAKRAFLLILLLGLITQISSAQNAFNTFDVGLSGDFIINNNTLLDNWNPTNGATLEARSPYFRGEMEVGVRYVYFFEGQFENSGFRSIFLFIGWSHPFSIADRLTVSPGFRLGNHFMWQDNTREYFAEPAGDPFVFHRNESEFAYEVQLRAAYQFTERTKLQLSTSYNRTAIEIPLSLVYAEIGVSRTFHSPKWLQKLVK